MKNSQNVVIYSHKASLYFTIIHRQNMLSSGIPFLNYVFMVQIYYLKECQCGFFLFNCNFWIMTFLEMPIIKHISICVKEELYFSA